MLVDLILPEHRVPLQGSMPPGGTSAQLTSIL